MTRTEIERQQRAKEKAQRAEERRKRIQAAQERQRQADIGTYGEGSELLKGQKSSSKGDSRGGIWDVDTQPKEDQNKQGTDDRIQNDGIDRVSDEQGDELAGFEETSIILCENGTPVNGSILFKPD